MSARLPAIVEDLRGLRAASWIRESTPGQFDRYGPDAQRELQARSAERLGLVMTELAWSAAQSGATVHSSPAMRAMLEAARAGAFDVLLVGYVARWQRNLRQTLNLLEEILHPAGVAVWFCDEELLSSNERHWDQLVDEAKAADSWLRKHRRRVREGLAAKLATKRDPGGHPPFGFRRDAEKLLEPDPDRLELVQRVFALAAARLTDRDVAEQTGIPLYTVRGMVRSPLYAGRLRDGRLTRFPPLVDPTLWDEVQAVRDRRRTRDGRPAIRRAYAISMLWCAACGRHLIGDSGRYRHTFPCEAFTAAAPRVARRWSNRTYQYGGQSYAVGDYEDLVRQVLGRAALGAGAMTRIVGMTRAPQPDRLALARVERERDAAVSRYRRSRDARALETTMADLDAQEAAARASTGPEPMPAAEAVEYLHDLPKIWAEAPDSRRQIAESLFERIDVLGLRTMHLEPTPAAVRQGLAEAFWCSEDGYGRGERTRPASNGLILVGPHGTSTLVTVGGIEPEPLRIVRTA